MLKNFNFNGFDKRDFAKLKLISILSLVFLFGCSGLNDKLCSCKEAITLNNILKKKSIKNAIEEAEKDDGYVSDEELQDLYYKYAENEDDPTKALDWYLLAAEKGDEYAAAKAGDMFLNGIGTEKNYDKALLWYKKAAAERLPYAEFQIGQMYHQGLGVDKNIKTSISWYQKSAKGGYIPGAIILAEMYRGWHGSNLQDQEKAIQWYQRAVSLGSETALFQMSTMMVDDPRSAEEYQTGIKNLESLLVKGDLNAASILGDAYVQGKGVEQDLSKAFKYYELAAKSGNPHAEYKLGRLYLTGVGVKKDAKKGVEWINKAAQDGLGIAQYNMGNLYYRGQGVDKSISTARTWYELAAKNGIPIAYAKLGDMYLSGDGGTPRYWPKAFSMYNEAAKKGNTYSQFMLSVLYREGHGIQQDLSKSVSWYKIASQKPDALFAIYEVGRNYEFGFGLKPNKEEAERWYKIAANGDFALAQVSLADIYADKMEGKINYSDAIFWYQKSAEQGFAYGQYSLALMFLHGNGVDKDPLQAAHWFKKSARQGYRAAQFQLGKMYFEGIGVKQNDLKAYAWWRISIQDGFDKFPEFMDKLINRMDPGARQQAVLLAKRYRDKYMIDEDTVIYPTERQ